MFKIIYGLFFCFLPAVMVSANTPLPPANPLSQAVNQSVSADKGWFTSIPFTQNLSDTLIVVSVQVNGHNIMPFLVDTGLTEPVIIEKWAADQLKLVPSKQSMQFSAHSHPFPMTTLQSLTVRAEEGDKDIEYNSFPAYISDVQVPSLNTPRIAGVLGLPLFYQIVMQLDFSRHVINLSKQFDHSQLEPNAVSLPLTQPDPASVRFFATWPLHSSTTVTRSVNEKGDKKVVTSTTTTADSLFLDTGANASSLSESTIPFVHPTAMGVEAHFNIEGVAQGIMAFVPQLSINRFVISDLCVRSPNFQQDQFTTDAIGLDILQHFRVTLDFPGKQMFLDKFDNKPATSAPTTTGIVLEKRDAGFFVQRVIPRSPAEKASIHAGDKITEVNGLPITTDDEGTAQDILDGNASTDANFLAVSADGNSRQITLPRLTLYDASLYPNYGFLPIKRSPDQAILVGYILCSSPAWSAGIRAGDTIVAVNKTPVQTTDQARSLLKPWSQKALTLTLKRDGKPLMINIRKTSATAKE